MNDVNASINEYLKNKNKVGDFNNYFNSSSILNTYKDIKNNRTIRWNGIDYYIKKVLRESDVLVISVGMDELYSNFDKYNMNNNYNLFNDMYSNLKRMLNEIKRYAYGKIIFVGYYNPTTYYDANIDRFFYDINIKLERLMIDYNITYIDLYELIKNNNYKERNSIYLNTNGIKKLASIIEYYLE